MKASLEKPPQHFRKSVLQKNARHKTPTHSQMSQMQAVKGAPTYPSLGTNVELKVTFSTEAVKPYEASLSF